LSTAFTPGHTRRQSTSPSNVQPSVTDEPVINSQESPHKVPSNEVPTSSSSDDAWRVDYEGQVQSWRAQSAEARERAERERARWEAIRAEEQTEASRQKAAGVSARKADHDPRVGKKKTPDPSEITGGDITSVTFSGIDAGKNLSSGEPRPLQVRVIQICVCDKFFVSLITFRLKSASSSASLDVSASSRHSKDNTGDASKLSISQKWENVTASPSSSFPSMSFPENSDLPSPDRPLQTGPLSVTQAIFDSTLPARARISALFSSLAINMLLPFVNGVMLGFGEIFAKNILIGWLGWKVPGSVVTNVGIGTSRSRRPD
jgi:hypothetical protein